MKLYVFRQYSPDPDDWFLPNGFTLVIAETPEQAQEVAGDLEGGKPTEVNMNDAALVCYVPMVCS